MLKKFYFVLGKWASLGYFCGGSIITQKKMNLEQSTSYLAALLHQTGLRSDISPRPLPDDLMTKAQAWSGMPPKLPSAITQSLLPIFYTISNNKPTKPCYYPLKALSLEESDLFPTENPKGDANSLKQGLQKDLAALKKLNLSNQNYVETLFFVLKKHWSQVALSAEQESISLFEALKIRAAIANCFDQTPNYDNMPSPLLMFCVDLSGIQDFLYNIAKSKAAKSLKGRSFYLQTLVDTAVEKIIQGAADKNIYLNWGHIVYTSGGKAMMLLPNTEGMKGILSAVEKEYLDHLFADIGSELYVCMDYVEWGYDANMQLCVEGSTADKHIGDLWKALIDKVAKKKQQKFKSILTTNFDQLFTPIADGGDTNRPEVYQVCAVTGEKIPLSGNKKEDKKRFNLNENRENEEAIYVSEIVKAQTELGNSLTNAKYYWINNERYKQDEQESFALNVHYCFSKIDTKKNIFQLRQSTLKFINNTDFLDAAIKTNSESTRGFMFYGGNAQPHSKTNKYAEKSFEELAGEYATSDGKFKSLGVLRMDVDGLGGVFAETMKSRKALDSLAAYATLSTQLDLFFSGYINTLRNRDLFKDWINIVYSGGDDLFIVGRWDLCLKFAEQIRSKFADFIGKLPSPSISGGIALVGAKLPISKAAEMAGDAESVAKKFGQGKKNAFALFATTKTRGDKRNKYHTYEAVSWDQEFELVRQLAHKIAEWIKNDKTTGFSKRLIHKIYQFRELKNEGKPDWRWLSAYYFARQRRKEPLSEAIFAMLTKAFMVGEIAIPDEPKNKTHQFSSDRAVDLLAIACRWAELLIRSKNKI